jgi:hypothetical protein
MKAKLIKSYKPLKETNIQNLRFSKILHDNKEYDGWITSYDPKTEIMNILPSIDFKPKEGDFFYFGERKDWDYKMQVLGNK